ncbi:BadM/Rrf2 family transcriptional regulator [Mobilisporobacter senegalensis]|uniref:BadM/Rrf2 family transcriptional regulator n=1 Tax=Mobilisporobacter senegalensis TaxID=1329262 RepID=A0A3N1XP65_9FIRM|nr:Rrf2 family transcriptional regulator [Mobilisporobacter senegalensis]ROR28426.1 BadM/Rrf2 family transcriptional regulator [Mobilisporobacter senegalensis]
MKVSTKGRYGLRALVDLTINSKDKHVSLVEIANRQNISLNYLEQVFGTLRKAGIVKSIKGAQGGYVLADSPENIKISTILTTLEGEFSIVDEGDSDKQLDSIQLAVKALVWDKINENVNYYLENTTLEDIANEHRRLNGTESYMYFI